MIGDSKGAHGGQAGALSAILRNNDGLIRKLLAMTVANGCTANEAATARAATDRLCLLTTVAAIDGAADPLLPPKAAAVEVGLSLPAYWKAVAAGLFPAPCYPSPRSPRWFRSELIAAVQSRRMLPAAAKEARRISRHGSAA
jgi:predicted DNA-binding transcriptional regulator AlpA